MKPRAPKKSCIDNEVLEARSSMLKYKKQLKHLRSRISRESLALIFGAWSGKKQFTSCWEVFNYGSTLRAGLLRPYASFTSRRQCVRTSLKSAKMRLMVQRLDPINEQQRRTAFSAGCAISQDPQICANRNRRHSLWRSMREVCHVARQVRL